MKNNKTKTMKKRLMALLLCVAMMLNGSVSALASEAIVESEVETLMEVAEEAHVHTEECYSFTKVSENTICGKEVVEGHIHGTSCYEITNTQECICGVNETEGHSHVDTCFETIENLVCDKEHSHDDSCYTISSELNCGQEESEEHTHGDECYEESKEITCGKEHSHDGGCYETETKNVCGLEEVEAHTHGEKCFKTVEVKTVICELEEVESHAHGEECYEWNKELVCTIEASEPEMAAEALVCEVCGKETCECEVLICEVCGKETCECEVVTCEVCGKEACECEALVCEVCGKETCECETLESVELVTEVDGTTITLIGPVSAFEKGKTYEITAAKVEAEEELETIEEALEEAAEAQKKVVESYQAFDIKIIEKDATDAVTNENFQPLNGTPVQVVFTGEKVAESVTNEETKVAVYWIDEENSATDMDAVSDGTDVVMETEHFSLYVITEMSEYQATYEELKKEVEELETQGLSTYEAFEKAVALVLRINDACDNEDVTEEQYEELKERVSFLINVYCENNPVSEMATGTTVEKEIVYDREKWLQEESNEEVEEIREQEAMQQNSFPKLRMASAWSVRNTTPSAKQIEEKGGKTEDTVNDVSVSKTIEGTDLENVFDITLEVKTNEKISELYKDPDVAVVIVMDLSNTMNAKYTGTQTTRYDAAMTAAGNFLYQFASNTTTTGTSQIGIVGFNTSAYEISALKRCSSEEVDGIVSAMETNTREIVKADGYKESEERFTNIEAGLKKAKDMLASSNCESKYVLLLTDGFPTTYVENGYTGYYTSSSSGTTGNDGVFYDGVLNRYCKYGTSYSDKAAIKAREMATTIKNNGISVFSVGVDIGGQTIAAYVNQSEGMSDASVVDRTSATYEIGDASSANSYKNWLGISIGSGAGYYYDSNNANELNEAFKKILEKIKIEISERSAAEWVVTDPMPIGSQKEKVVEFIKFYDKSGNMSESLSGKWESNAENTATFKNDSITINWDLKNSGYTSEKVDGVTTYTYTLKYRVRLKNEESDFLEGTVYDTNNPTVLSYRVIKNNVKSDVMKLDFEIPSVKGYLSELEFKKVDPDGNPVVGATFTLTHDTASCGYCRGDESKSVTIKDFTATSNAQGNVVFNNIPSGHIYKLKETGVPAGYFSLGEEYQVTVAYDDLTVELIGASDEWVWNSKIVNGRMYELPSTGGIGTEMYKISGLALMSVATLFLHKKKKDEEV